MAEEQVLILQPHKTFPEFAEVICKNCVQHFERMLNQLFSALVNIINYPVYVADIACSAFQSASRHAAALPELCRPSGSTQAAAR